MISEEGVTLEGVGRVKTENQGGHQVTTDRDGVLPPQEAKGSRQHREVGEREGQDRPASFRRSRPADTLTLALPLPSGRWGGFCAVSRLVWGPVFRQPWETEAGDALSDGRHGSHRERALLSAHGKGVPPERH